ncbi:MAG: DUF4258 domain-containing protein [Patescibacteria group bacterium]
MIVFSKHVNERSAKRRILGTHITQTVQFPEEVIASSKGRKLRRKKFGDKILEVVTITEGSKITVITAYYLEKNHEN